MTKTGPKRRTLAERLWEKVDCSRGDEACWPFTGACNEDGYGLMTVWVESRGGWVHAFGAHRAAYMVAHGLTEPPSGIVRHSCDNPPCCNPKHLLLGTVGDNVRDCIERRRHRYAENPQPGEHNGRAKLTDDDVREIRALVAAGYTKASLGRAFGVTDVMIGRIARGEAWASVA